MSESCTKDPSITSTSVSSTGTSHSVPVSAAFGLKDFLAAHKQFVELHGTLTSSAIMPIVNVMKSSPAAVITPATHTASAAPDVTPKTSVPMRLDALEVDRELVGSTCSGSLLQRLQTLETDLFGETKTGTVGNRLSAVESLVFE